MTFSNKKKRRSALKPRPKTPVHFTRTPVEAIAPEEQIVGAPLIGKVASYRPDESVILLLIEESLSVGDAIRIKGRTTDLTQRIERLQIGERSVQSALAGESVKIRVAHSVSQGDAVYKVRAT